MMTLLATSSWGVPRAMWKPASLKTWNIWTELVEGSQLLQSSAKTARRRKEDSGRQQPGSFRNVHPAAWLTRGQEGG